MKKIVFTLLICLLSNFGYSQMAYRDTKRIKKSTATLDLTIYEDGRRYLFLFDFFNSDDCQKKSELIIKTKSGEIKKKNYNKRFGCDKEFAGFSIDTSDIRLEDIELIRYFNLNTLENYDFKINLK